MHKICFFCGSKNITKDGHSGSYQRVVCKDCGKRYVDKKRIKPDALYKDYLIGKQSIRQIAEHYGVSTRTVSRYLEKVTIPQRMTKCREVVLLMDATYRGKQFGVMVFKDALTKQVLWYKFLNKKETIKDYLEGIAYIEQHYVIRGGVCDGLKGLINALDRYPIQYCQFHQVKTIRTYLTQHPESLAGKELLALTYMMKDTDKESFVGAFGEWCIRHDAFLKERSKPNKKGKTHYIHKRLRSAYLSLKRNMPYLWVWHDHIELGIPPTNNGIEAMFTDLKTHMRLHNGLNREHQKTFIEEYFRRTHL